MPMAQAMSPHGSILQPPASSVDLAVSDVHGCMTAAMGGSGVEAEEIGMPEIHGSTVVQRAGESLNSSATTQVLLDAGSR